MTDQTRMRKRDHLEPFRHGSVPSRAQTHWLTCVELVHQALPELALNEIDLSASLAGHPLRAPLMITGMTGGTEEARDINQTLARAAGRLGLAFGVGSGRAMLEDPSLTATYDVRDSAPDAFLCWNLGGVQVCRHSVDQIRRALDALRLDAICVHLNPAQELAQPEGDRDFRGVLKGIAELVRRLERPVIVKETGAGLSRETGRRLFDVGVRTVDAAGVGGTSWVGVELLRSDRAEDPEVRPLWDWGLPTAAAVAELQGVGLEVIASGGIRTGLEAAQAIALGASAVGVAAPLLQAYYEGGEEAILGRLEALLSGLRRALLLTGCRDLSALQKAPRVIADPLRCWLEQRAVLPERD